MSLVANLKFLMGILRLEEALKALISMICIKTGVHLITNPNKSEARNTFQ